MGAILLPICMSNFWYCCCSRKLFVFAAQGLTAPDPPTETMQVHFMCSFIICAMSVHSACSFFISMLKLYWSLLLVTDDLYLLQFVHFCAELTHIVVCLFCRCSWQAWSSYAAPSEQNSSRYVYCLVVSLLLRERCRSMQYLWGVFCLCRSALLFSV